VPLGLVTDLYQLTMAAGYFEAGKARDRALAAFAEMKAG